MFLPISVLLITKVDNCTKMEMKQKTRKGNTLKESCSSLENNCQILVNLNGCTNQIELTELVVISFALYLPLTFFYKVNGDVLKSFSTMV
jgi:hypothetical protein